MILRFLSFSRFAALLVAGLGFSAAPASACGFFGGCWAPAPVVVQYYQPSCGCCGCGGPSYYSSYLPAYGYPPYGSVYGGGCGYGCGGGFGYGGGYGGGYGAGYGGGYGAAAFVAPPVGPYFGPRRYWGPRRAWARY